MSEYTETYQIQGSRVYGNGWSYNLTNRADAVHLHQILNTYEEKAKENEKILTLLKGALDGNTNR